MNKKEVLRMDYTKKLLEVRDLHKAYSKEGVPTKALNGITFDVLNGSQRFRENNIIKLYCYGH